MLVVGGGDAAMEEAHFLTKFADTVYLVAPPRGVPRRGLLGRPRPAEGRRGRNRAHAQHRARSFTAPPRTASTTSPSPNAEGHPSEKLDADGTETFDFDVGAVFIAIGHTPNTDYLGDTGVELDDTGYIRTHGGTGGDQTATDVAGIFGAGDVVDYHYQQAVTAGGMGVRPPSTPTSTSKHAEATQRQSRSRRRSRRLARR